MPFTEKHGVGGSQTLEVGVKFKGDKLLTILVEVLKRRCSNRLMLNRTVMAFL
jgi:hypothetical protein